MNMPKVNIEKVDGESLTDEEREIFNIVIKKDNSVRASKPKVTKDDLTGKAAYVWRMVCFFVSPKSPHKCMPCTASFDLPAYDENGKWCSSIARVMEKDLDILVDKITNAVDKREWHGVHSWGRALGK
jgi:hypothetical protein